jgi:CubicO group peptidase (beta-lactamase class C family)
MRRRDMLGLAVAQAAPGAVGLDSVLRDGIKRRGIPAVVAAVATVDRTTYSGAFGIRDQASAVAVTPRSIFSIASMTKAVTTVAALQLAERGKLGIDDLAANHAPALANPRVLEGFDTDGRPVLRPAARPITLRHLLTHTSGLAYDTWNADMFRLLKDPAPQGVVLAFDPGERWNYGTSTDWLGRIVEAVSGQTLEAYFQANILGPLGMEDTSYILPVAKFRRKVSNWKRQADDKLAQSPYSPPKAPPTSFNGGGGLAGTVPDYVRFLQMILRRGVGTDGRRILGERWIGEMLRNQVGSTVAGRMKSTRPDMSSDVDFHPGFEDRFTFGFLMNPEAHPGGRSAGSLAWAGMNNTFFWVDPAKGLCAVVAMQFLPFCDREAIGLLRDFERAVYRS